MILLNTATRSSVVVFLTPSGFLRQKAAVNSLSINILWKVSYLEGGWDRTGSGRDRTEGCSGQNWGCSGQNWVVGTELIGRDRTVFVRQESWFWLGSLQYSWVPCMVILHDSEIQDGHSTSTSHLIIAMKEGLQNISSHSNSHNIIRKQSLNVHFINCTYGTSDVWSVLFLEKVL